VAALSWIAVPLAGADEAPEIPIHPKLIAAMAAMMAMRIVLSHVLIVALLIVAQGRT
jgi:hypothetical protein